MSDFRFDPDTHTYYLDNRVLPGVTTVLSEWYKVGHVYYNILTGQTVPGNIWEAAQDRGNAVHDMLKLCLIGQGVDRAVLHPDLLPYLKPIEDFITDYQPGYTLVEKPLCDKRKMYAGKPDFYGMVKGVKNPVLFDAKSGMAGNVRAQTSAYENLARIETGRLGPIDRYWLSIKPEGYRFEKIGTPQDFKYFCMKLSIYKYERGL